MTPLFVVCPCFNEAAALGLFATRRRTGRSRSGSDCVMDELGCGDEDTVVNMDSDGQHPPERIPEMMEARRQGFLLCGTYILSEVSKIAQGGRFVARIFDEVTRRPAYVIEELPT